jgi:hypothetical protein
MEFGISLIYMTNVPLLLNSVLQQFFISNTNYALST